MASVSGKPEFELRAGRLADSAALVPLINAAFQPEQVAIAGDRIDLTGLRRYFESGRFLLLESAEGLAGCVYLEVRGERGYVGLLAVRPEWQGRGLGRLLLARAEQSLAEAGCRAADLRTISARNDLLPMYRHLGYREIATEQMPAHVALKMPCHFIVMSKLLVVP
jgi:GNAT superfamily N-acetyltransferase